MYFEYYLMGIILLPALIFASYAQIKVNTTYNKYSSVYAQSNITAAELLKRLIYSCNMSTHITQVSGSLTDHYNPKTNEIALSQSNYNSTSVSSLGIACHEFGHALQKKERYLPYQIRKVLIPVTNFASTLLWPLVVIGLIFNFAIEGGGTTGNIFLWSGIIFFGLAVLVNLVTLPVEFNASRRAVNILRQTNALNEEELKGTKKVLKAAALTYVAALAVSILNFLRFILVVLSRSRRD
ncbi:MAG: zinc metallopeptidase [Clostridia bacterium]|nr:zinc metallopeptidase [Clostridia bacterium]